MPPFRFNTSAGEMKESLERVYEFSLFSSIADMAPQTITFDDFVLLIEGGDYADLVSQIRMETDGKRRKSLKKMLPAATISGVFSGGHHETNLQRHSGLICLDFDLDDNPQLKGNTEQIRDLLAEDEFCKFVFISAGGNGIAAIVRVEPERHAEAFSALLAYFKSEHGLTADAPCSDRTRLRFISWDEGCKTNESARVFKRYSLAEVVDRVKPELPNSTSLTQKDTPNLTMTPLRTDEIGSALAFISPDNRGEWIQIGMAIHSECSHLQGFELFRRWSELNDCTGKFDDSDLDRNWKSFGRKGGVKIETLFAKAYKAGWKGAPVEMELSRDGLYDISASDLKEMPCNTPEVIIEGLMHVGELCEIVAPSKCRKSFFVQQLAMSVSCGKKFLIWPVPKPRVVLLFNIEVQPAWMQIRIKAMARSAFTSDDITDCRIVNTRGQKFDNLKAEIIKKIRLVRPDLAIIDPIYLVHDEDENDQKHMKILLKEFHQICSECNCTLLIVHHDPKGMAGDRNVRDRGSGSSVSGRINDLRIILTPHSDDSDNMTCVEALGRNIPAVKGCVVQFLDGAFRVTDLEVSVKKSKAEPKKFLEKDKMIGDAIDAVVPYIVENGPFCVTDIQDLLEQYGVKKSDTHKRSYAIKILNNRIEKAGGEYNGVSKVDRGGGRFIYGTQGAIMQEVNHGVPD